MLKRMRRYHGRGRTRCVPVCALRSLFRPVARAPPAQFGIDMAAAACRARLALRRACAGRAAPSRLLQSSSYVGNLSEPSAHRAGTRSPVELSSPEEIMSRVLKSDSSVFLHSAAATPTRLVEAMASGESRGIDVRRRLCAHPARDRGLRGPIRGATRPRHSSPAVMRTSRPGASYSRGTRGRVS